jgi:hypothetical protein
MSKRDNTLHIRLSPEDRWPLDELQNRFSESGINLTDSDLVRLAIRRLPVDDPAALLRPPEGRP